MIDKWERKGDCNSCGWCCQFLQVQRMTVLPHAVTPDIARCYLLRNGVQTEDGSVQIITHIFSPCQAHDAIGKKCTIYADRPEACKVFPTFPEQIEGSPCTYWFEKTGEDGSIERRGGLDSPHPSPPRFDK